MKFFFCTADKRFLRKLYGIVLIGFIRLSGSINRKNYFRKVSVKFDATNALGAMQFCRFMITTNASTNNFFNTFEKICNKNGENPNFISKLSCKCKILY